MMQDYEQINLNICNHVTQGIFCSLSPLHSTATLLPTVAAQNRPSQLQLMTFSL